MGVTLHYRGRLKPKESARNLYILAKLEADSRKWKISPFTEGEGKLEFRRNPAVKLYEGPMSSFTITPHDNCEPFHLALTREGYFEDRCKTQFAPLEVHVGLVEILDALKTRLADLIVEDEGQYFEGRSKERLEQKVFECFEEILKTKEEDPSYYGPVKDDQGRITDLVKEE